MLESIPVSLIVGTLLGILSGLGVGGGSLLILWLTLVLGMDYPAARFLNLLYFLPAAMIASLFRQKRKQISIKGLMPAILAGCAAAALFTWLGRYITTAPLQKLFGAMLLVVGIRELLYKQK